MKIELNDTSPEILCSVPYATEDERIGMKPETLRRAFQDNLVCLRGKSEQHATPYDQYMALAMTIRDRLIRRWIDTIDTYLQGDLRVVFYLSAEYLTGRQLGANLLNTGSWHSASEALKEMKISLEDLLLQELEPGLGNGGLGRLAACYLESLATLDIPAFGHGIRYEYGIFKQRIKDGSQVELPDYWLSLPNPWEIQRYEHAVEVQFGGHTEWTTEGQGKYRAKWIPERTVLGVPFDTLIPGFHTNSVGTLRLWSARASQDFDFELFNSGDYTRAVEEKTLSESISKVLYPSDNTPQGRELRLKQQYFFVSCALHDAIAFYRLHHKSFDGFADKIAIQLNDTHPVIAIPELMRLLVDIYLMEWDHAWDITRRTFGYTNHTVLPEALERWSVPLLQKLLPRHLEIIFEINRRFLEKVRRKYPNDTERIKRMSIVEEGQPKFVRMGNLAIVGSHTVNGVSKLHTRIIQESIFKDFSDLGESQFINITNGITPRRWLMLSNPALTHLITEHIGSGWLKDLEELSQLEKLSKNSDFLEAWRQVKLLNKTHLLSELSRAHPVPLDPNALFDVQVKRIHEYKRQLLFILYIVSLYRQLKHSQEVEAPRVCIISGKAAPGYAAAKLIIRLINSVAHVINNDPDTNRKLSLHFIENFCVSVAENIYPASDLSEQISTAGKEASGTGNMKLGLNGALTIGTYDGANIEMFEAVGEGNYYCFGHRVEELLSMRQAGYNPQEFVNKDPSLAEAIEMISGGYFSPEDPTRFHPLMDALLTQDEFMLLADFDSYRKTQAQIGADFLDVQRWTQKSILNTARLGIFSADRAVREYCEKVWHQQSVSIKEAPSGKFEQRSGRRSS